jgi:hypothetical protein
MLDMMEWWLCLSMPPEEVENIACFEELSEAERRLLLAARKEPGLHIGASLTTRLPHRYLAHL